MEEVWKSVLDEIEIEVSKPIFLTFFKTCALASLDNGVATIDAPTYMTAQYIEKRYYSLIKRVIDKKTNQNLSLVFTSDGVFAKTKKKIEGPLFIKDKQETRIRPLRIRSDYTFETLAVSESNQLAYTASQTVAQNLGTRYNPLYLYGTVGVGKTHLMNAIANKAYDANPNFKVIYLTTEEFTNEVVEAIKDKTTSELRRRFRSVDLLLLDDVQFLTGKERVQEELFHTFNALIDKGRQVVFSSDRPPYEIKKIEARLASRFEGGLSVDIEAPDFELRCAILLIKSRKYGINLGLEGAKTVAGKIEDTRALEGFLLRLSSVCQAGPDEVSLDVVEQVLGKGKKSSPVIRADDVISAICSYYSLKTTQLKGAKRDSFLVGPRHVCMFLLKEEVGLTFVEIGNLLGGRDHTTVMHGVEKTREMMERSERTREEILFIKRKIKEDFVQ